MNSDDEAPRVPPRRGLRDVDSFATALRVKTLAWSLIGGLPGAAIGARYGAPIAGGLLGVGAMFAFTLVVAERAGRIGSTLYFSAGSASGRREYSLADSLIARGRIDDAIAELQKASTTWPDDPEPPLRLARLLRDQAARPTDAIAWFRTAVERSRNDAGAEIAALRELIEVHTHVLATPRAALPYLARLASRHPDSAAGAWARAEMGGIKQAMRDEEGT